MDIPEHPEIAMALATGYPHPERPCIHCCDCDKALTNEDVFDWDGDILCEGCVKERIEENYTISEIAVALGIPRKPAYLWEVE